MALIDEKIIKKTKERNYVHEKVEATYTVFKDNRGKKYIQIDTYGTKSRKVHGKVSQSLQFDEATLKYLIKIFKKELDF